MTSDERQLALDDLKIKFKDKLWRLNHLYWIKDKSGVKTKFKLNKAQAEYHANKHNRNINLKARQIGFTTYACIDALDNCLFNSNYDAGIIAHNLNDAEKIFTNKVKFSFDNLPDLIKALKKPNTDRSGELRFPNGSSISVSTGFRGGTLRQLHVSEFGKICTKFPDKAREIVTGAFNAVPIDGEITIESTAEGYGGYFFDMCEKAQNRGNQNLTQMDFKFHFYPWYNTDEYRINPDGIVIPKETAEYFIYLKEAHNIDLDDHQKAWYVKKSDEQGDDIKREYPSYPEEAFQASGRPVFNIEKLAAEIKLAKEKTHDLQWFTISGTDSVFRYAVKVFKKPISTMAFSVGADCSEGLVDGDSSTIAVLDKDFNQVASFKGKIDPDIFGKLLVAVARYYNNAVLAPEVNNMGIAVIESIKRERYYKLYKREVREELGKDMQEKIGWWTNIKTKMLMIDELKAAHRDSAITINDEETLREMMTCTIEEDGNVILNSKDLVVALAISVQAIKQASLDGEYKAFIPTSNKAIRDVTKLGLQDRLKYYNRMKKS
jgi:hypothetical protein